MKLRPDLLDARSPAGLEVLQITEEALPSCHIYMEAQIFTPDSRRFVLHRSAHPHGSDQNDPQHRYLLCNLEEGGKLSPLTEETGVTAPSVSPDGKYLYYFVNQTQPGGGKLTLQRVHLDGSGRQTILTIDGPLPGTRYRPGRIYPLSTISSDGRRLAISAFLGDGQTPCAPYGLMVFDLVNPSVQLVLSGPSWCNMHPQYCRSRAAAASHDILVQENHGNVHDEQGNITLLVGGAGADIHLLRDDGSHFRDLPWGRDGNEACQGHQCWRGRSQWAITSTITSDVRQAQLIEALPVASRGDHVGLSRGDAQRNHLSREVAAPHFYHFATDEAGATFITDADVEKANGGAIYWAELGQAGRDAFASCQFLLSPRTRGEKGAHVHPFLAPDGRSAFFNSDESGTLQAYMIRGLENLPRSKASPAGN